MKLTLTPMDPIVSGDNPISWYPESTIIAYIISDADNFKPCAQVNVSNGNILTCLAHTSVERPSEGAVGRGFDYYMGKPVGQYWTKAGATKLKELLIFVVAPGKRSVNPFTRKIDGSK